MRYIAWHKISCFWSKMVKNRPFFLWILIFFLRVPLAEAQVDNKVDSLMNVLQKAEGLDSFASLKNLAELLSRTDREKAFELVAEMERLVRYHQKPELNLIVLDLKGKLYHLQFQYDSLQNIGRKGLRLSRFK
jgi:hypothetical protein